jgi:TetR/AcrR family transcriptional regulator, lmrAB and yxaGH operons repressor
MGSETRQRMIAGAARLLARRGLQETSFAEVLALTGAPRGSIYHHFPDGKDQLIAAAIDLAGEHAESYMDLAAGTSAQNVTAHFLRAWRTLLEQSDFQAGCSVLAVTVATDSTGLLDHAAQVFRNWRAQLARLLHDGGLLENESRQFAALLIASTEGAVAMSRAEHSMEPFDLVSDSLTQTVAGLNAAS